MKRREKMKIYLYGMICGSNSFLLDEFPTPDEYSEISRSYRFAGGETGTCATVLSSFGAEIKMDGTHSGRNTVQLVRDFYKEKSVDISSLTFDEDFEGIEDYIIISGNCRTPMSTFGKFYEDARARNKKHWNTPKEDDIAWCDTAALDAFFGEDSQLAAGMCVKLGKPYVTIDCKYDSFIHSHAAVTVISGEFIGNSYKGKTREELFPYFVENSGGLTIITNGGKGFYYGRKGEAVKTFTPYKVNVVSTLGAGDTFKAGCTYALAKGMDDDEIVRFASACAGVAVSRYPMQLDPPTLGEVETLMNNAYFV